MNDDVMARIERLVKLNLEDQNFLLRYFARLPLNLRTTVLARHRRTMYSIKQKHPETTNEEASYAGMILALKSLYAQERKLSRKDFKDMSIEEIADLSLMDVKIFESKLPSPTPKRDKVLQHWALIKLLRNEGMSFRKIATYMKRKRVDVGHSLIHSMWIEFENNNEKGSENA